MADRSSTSAPHVAQFPGVVIRLLKGVVYRRDDERVWNTLIATQAHVRDYVKVMNLQLEIDDAEGFAFLRLRKDSDPEQVQNVPQLISRRPLSRPASLLLALLRKKLVELDAERGDTRLILTRDEIVETMRVFLPETSNEARLRKQVVGYVNRIVGLGFMRRMNAAGSVSQPTYEVRRIIKKFVDAQWLANFEAKLAEQIQDRSSSAGEQDA